MTKSLTATLKYALVSDKKMSLMAKLVQGKRVEDALNILKLLPKKAAKILLKVVLSAYSNAKNSWEAKDFTVKEVQVGAGPKIKRIRFTSRSRISHYEKSRCYVKVILAAVAPKIKKSVKDELTPKVAKKPATKKTVTK